jgi:hypothetical protein
MDVPEGLIVESRRAARIGGRAATAGGRVTASTTELREEIEQCPREGGFDALLATQSPHLSCL